MELGETTTRRIRSGTRMSTSSMMTANLLAASWQDSAGVDAQMVSVEADAAQIRNGRSDAGSGGDAPTPMIVATPAARAAAIPAGASSNTAQH